MKKGFTLIELLITVTVMATLMTIMFKLGTSSSDESRRINTITRMQKLENALSGYFAAFGSYPPVALHGSRNIYTEVQNGVQTGNQNDTLDWEQIDAACRSQPFEACFPFPDDAETREMIQTYSDYYKELAKGGGWSKSPHLAAFTSGFGLPAYGEFTSYARFREWEQVQVFKFGVMSYLLPRYLVMMKGDEKFYSDSFAQWNDNNDSCLSATDGRSMSWNDVHRAVERDPQNDPKGNGGIKSMSDYIKVANMPTQSVCARWLGNLEGICATGHEAGSDRLFGVSIKDPDWDMFDCDENNPPEHLNIYTPGGQGSNWYVLDTITVFDGWKNNFYYYAPPGAQSYTLWSAGPNGRTFPPWADKTGILDKRPNDRAKGSALTVSQWLEDDIVGMKH